MWDAFKVSFLKKITIFNRDYEDFKGCTQGRLNGNEKQEGNDGNTLECYGPMGAESRNPVFCGA